jgi:hypothetical protein
MVTFEVSKVEKAIEAFDQVSAQERLTKRYDEGRIIGQADTEASVSNAPLVIDEGFPNNGFAQAVYLAYAHHFPLSLSPDDVWLAIAQGFAIHVLQNAEKFRERFAPGSAAGTKEVIRIHRDRFVKGSPDNDWPGVFDEFSQKVGERIGLEKLRLVRSDFSTTGPIEKAASEIVLLEGMKNYFDYLLTTRCGIPEITLTGTPTDWRNIRLRAQALGEYDLSWWIEGLLPTLDQFIRASEGQADPIFWQSLCKDIRQGSGGPYVTGWINQFFPYVHKYDGSFLTNKGSFGPDLQRLSNGINPCQFPSGLSNAPFIWKYLAQELPMEFLGGFVGTHQDPTSLQVRPAIGWLVKSRSEAPQR